MGLRVPAKPVTKRGVLTSMTISGKQASQAFLFSSLSTEASRSRTAQQFFAEQERIFVSFSREEEFELHARAILGIPILDIQLLRKGASSVVLADKESVEFPSFSGLEEATKFTNTDFKIFGKPSTHPFRRMAVALAYGNEDVKDLVSKAKKVSDTISVDC